MFYAHNNPSPIDPDDQPVKAPDIKPDQPIPLPPDSVPPQPVDPPAPPVVPPPVIPGTALGNRRLNCSVGYTTFLH